MTAKEAIEILQPLPASRLATLSNYQYELRHKAEGFLEGHATATKAAEPLLFVITALTNRLGQAQHQIGKRTQILKEGTEEIECCLVPSYELDELLSCCAEIVEKYKKETLGQI